MSGSPTNRSAKSNRSNRSGVSRTSISVTLPPTTIAGQGVHGELPDDSLVQIQRMSPAPDRVSPYQGRPDSNAGERKSNSHLSNGTVPPQGTPTKPVVDKEQIRRMIAARIIERAWSAYRDQQMFKLLKHAICAAEHSLSHEILRKVCPKESEFLKDKCLQTKVRFRFGGLEFPPLIYFKVFTCVNGGMGVKYLSGKKMIQPASEAARDACDLMGNRKFLGQIIQDTVHHETHKITDEVDVTTLKDYMQYISLLDETPAHLGGRDNSWRRLTLEDLPRQTIFYDVVEFLYSKHITPRLQEEIPALLIKPISQEVQMEHIRIISELRSPSPPAFQPRSRLSDKPGHISGRRSKQARLRALKMRKMYELQKEGQGQPGFGDEHFVQGGDMMGEGPTGIPEEDEDWEREASKLYEWTQELSFDEILATPRLNTAQC